MKKNGVHCTDNTIDVSNTINDGKCLNNCIPDIPEISLTSMSPISHNSIQLNITNTNNSIYNLKHYVVSYTITNAANNIGQVQSVKHDPITVDILISELNIVLPVEKHPFPMIALNDIITVKVTKVFEEDLKEEYSAIIEDFSLNSKFMNTKQYFICGLNNIGQAGYTVQNNISVVDGTFFINTNR